MKDPWIQEAREAASVTREAISLENQSRHDRMLALMEMTCSNGKTVREMTDHIGRGSYND